MNPSHNPHDVEFCSLCSYSIPTHDHKRHFPCCDSVVHHECYHSAEVCPNCTEDNQENL